MNNYSPLLFFFSSSSSFLPLLCLCLLVRRAVNILASLIIACICSAEEKKGSHVTNHFIFRWVFTRWTLDPLHLRIRGRRGDTSLLSWHLASSSSSQLMTCLLRVHHPPFPVHFCPSPTLSRVIDSFVLHLMVDRCAWVNNEPHLHWKCYVNWPSGNQSTFSLYLWSLSLFWSLWSLSFPWQMVIRSIGMCSFDI